MSLLVAASVLMSSLGVGAEAQGARPSDMVAGHTAVARAVGHRLTGAATWYGTGPGRGEAAAGPALRRALGVHWRNARVQVCRLARCVIVRASDWCRCDGGRIIDLSDEDFIRLAPLWRGVITVRVVRA